ncbi:hypothetical protein HZS_4633 [Henneguya salminicola]|nr:hypothetical protein HZS_4633 [Henneguya salminicola]
MSMNLSEEAKWTDEEGSIEIDPVDIKKIRRANAQKFDNPVKEKELEDILREEFIKINGIPSWTNPQIESDEDCDDINEQQIIYGSVVSSKRSKLKITPLFDANQSCRLPQACRFIEFHPSKNILLAAGRHDQMQLFDINKDCGSLLKTLKIENFPIRCAHFCNSGTEIILSSRNRHLYFYNLEKGQGSYLDRIRGRSEKMWEKFCVSPCGSNIAFVGDNGEIPLISSKSRSPLFHLTQGSSLKDIIFSKHDENILYSIGSFGDIYVWELRARRCINKITNPALFDANCLCVSNSGIMASGSESGLVSLMDFSTSLETTTNFGSVIKEFSNLTLPTCDIKFNEKFNLMCFASNNLEKGIRMVDLNNMSVMISWPFSQLNNGIRNIFGFDFSSDGKYLAIGNNNSRLLIHGITSL